ncbi:hypothetical protein B5M09_000189 [Aphanomyces astaci]|uniref:Anaphase-promoting complex subunit 4 WD40 domain-containing protein n=1 Tax=Aphanomyces astaci TaxID=112090 RepID=A0A3R7WXX2_APHAT|nr:hypothetical protein B5M09_000189 [Aphanomyces astaci]
MFRCVMHSQRPQRSVVAARGAHCPRYIPFPKVAKMKKLFKLASTYHGVGPVTFAWQPAGNFLATAGKNGLVHIFDRQGEQYDEIGLDMGTPVLALEWDHDGNTLAILQTGNGIVPLWDLSARTTQNLDTNLKDPSFIPIGTVKGNLVLYSKSSRKIVPVLGKHSKKITCGAWNNSDQLVLGSDDRMITVSNAGGDTLQQRELKLVWFNGGYLMISFSEGFVICISTQMDEIGEEMFSGRFFSERLYAVCYSPILNRIAISGESGIKVVDMSNYTEIKADAIKLTDAEDNEANLMAYTNDGQILTVATQGGIIQTFLARMPNIFDHVGNYVAFLSSLREITVVDTGGRDAPIHIQVSIEPSFIALGPRHVAVGMNNRVWFYRCDGSNRDALVNEQQYLGRVTCSKTFPDTQGRDDREISSIALTKDFFIYATSGGGVHFFYLHEWKMLEGCSYRHEDGVGIVHIAPNNLGTKVVLIDSRRRGYILNATNREALYIPSVPNSTSAILWDTADPTVFVAVEPTEFTTFLYTELTINGPEVTQLGTMDIDLNGDFSFAPQSTKIPPGHSAVLFADGVLTTQQPGGTLTTIVSCTHEALQRVYRQLGDAGMVMGLNRIEHVEDKNLLAGHVSMLFGQYDQAQKLYLNSTEPMAALTMQRYLLQWDQALLLADSLAVHLVPELSASYAAQLEFKGDVEGALKMYEHACNAVDPLGNPVVASEKTQTQSMAGIARCTLRTGDLRRGIRLVTELNDIGLCKECGLILEGMKQLSDAAQLYERGEVYEKAAQIYIQMKQLHKAAPLMAKVHMPKVHMQFAKAKEAAGEFAAASDAYEAAMDLDSVVRIQLEHLNNAEKAFSIVKQTKSSEGASAVAKYCIESANYAAAIDFLLMANREDDAFQLAQAHNEIDAFTKTIGDGISVERALKIAQHYEQTQAHARAGEFYQVCGNFHKALRLFLQCGETELGRAIDVVGKARNDMLTHTLIDYLMGDTDGIPKDPNYIFRLYMALGNYAQAAKTAIIIARQEQELGNYKVAHDVLVETHRQLQLHKIHVNQDLRNSLTLLHSYVVVKKLVKRGDHMSAAKMLVRVAKNISKFPTHVSNILISAVIECQRAGLKGSSYDFATQLMRPEHRNGIDKEIKRKIEAIVRRPNKEQPPDTMTPCPFCDHEVVDVDLDCGQCKNWIPYCAVTGYHMVKTDWSQCPHCQFPALYSHLVSHLEAEPICPMCDKELKPDDVQKVSENDVKLATIELQQPEQAPLPAGTATKDGHNNQATGKQQPPKQGELFA